MNDNPLKKWPQLVNKHMKTFPHDFLVFLVMGGWLIFFLFLADLGTKLGMQSYFGANENAPVINLITDGNNNTVLGVQLAYNKGMGYGLEANRALLASISGIVGLGLIIYLAYKFGEKPWYLRYALYFLIAGDLGNFIDRAFYLSYPKGVIDWIVIGNDDWPKLFHFICNFADIWLFFGVIFLIIAIIVILISEYKADQQPAPKTKGPKATSKAKIGSETADLARLKKDLEDKKDEDEKHDE